MSDSLSVVIDVLSVKKRNVITIPSSLVNGDTTLNVVKIGLLTQSVSCRTNNTSNVIKMSPDLFDKLGLKKGFTCQAKSKENTLHLGPVIGVFVASSYTDRLVKTQRAKDRTLELFKANEEAHTLLYFFSAQDVLAKKRKVKGTYYDPYVRRWKTHLFPLPTALYDRGSGMSTKRIPLKPFRRKLQRFTNMKRINAQHYFDKLDLYYKLKNFPEMRPYLPMTLLYKGPADLKKMFDTTNSIYIKKLVSSNGLKILRAKKVSGGYLCSTFTNKVLKKPVKSLFEVHQVIRRVYGSRKVLLQEGISLISINNSNVDMRATVQRNGKGELKITNTTVRVGEKGSPVTSTRSGSRCYPIREFMKNQLRYTDEQINQLESKIEKFLLIVYTCTEKAYGRFGEIGIDFALDTEGNIKFIECNAKPAKTSLFNSADQGTIREAFRNPLDYGKYICGF